MKVGRRVTDSNFSWLPQTPLFEYTDRGSDRGRSLTTCFPCFMPPLPYSGGTRYRSWLRHYATRRKVAGSSPDEVIGFFNLPNPSSHTMAVGSTQPQTEMSTRNLPEG
jgi:hypothetical protein